MKQGMGLSLQAINQPAGPFTSVSASPITLPGGTITWQGKTYVLGQDVDAKNPWIMDGSGNILQPNFLYKILKARPIIGEPIQDKAFDPNEPLRVIPIMEPIRRIDPVYPPSDTLTQSAVPATPPAVMTATAAVATPAASTPSKTPLYVVGALALLFLLKKR